MIASMTAFSRTDASDELGRTIWEIRTVNHRYLEMGIRLPDDLRALEPAVRERISAKLRRGKVDCLLRYEPGAADDQTLSFDAALARRVIEAADSLPINGPAVLNRLDVLRWPGVTGKPVPDIEAVSPFVLEALDRGLDTLVEARRREGVSIRKFIIDRCNEADEQVARVRARIPDIMQGIRERYLQRATEMQADLDRDRLEQEMLLLAQKLDVAEELDRLETHVGEVRRALDDEKPVGRRLDFLMQEMNREANTLGSKSAHIDVSNSSVDLKVLIEQMREQVQNIE